VTGGERTGWSSPEPSVPPPVRVAQRRSDRWSRNRPATALRTAPKPHADTVLMLQW